MEQLTALGTGYAIATNCYTTCFTISDGKEHFMIDTGGGNTILTHLKKAGIDTNQVHHVFLSHKHTDHILGAVWLIRMIGHGMTRGSYQDTLTIYGPQEVLDGLQSMCRFMLPSSILPLFGQRILFYGVTHGQTLEILQRKVTFFDTHSKKDVQFGVHITLQNKKTLVFLGDEPFDEANGIYAYQVDYFMHEAMCLYAQVEQYHPYAIAHSSVKEACQAAQAMQAATIILHHTEDQDIPHRKQRYTAEAKTFFDGTVYVPDDLDVIPLD